MTIALERRLNRLEREWQARSGESALRLCPDWMEEDLRSQPWSEGLGSRGCADWQYRALPAQRAFHRDLTARFKGFSGPIGSGKSFALVYEALLLSRMNPGLLGLVGAPTYRMLEDATQRTFFEVLATENIDYSFHKQENRVRLAATGSEIIFRSMENPDRLRGPNLAWFALDELTYTREEAWKCMVGRLRHPRARRLCGCAVWTPRGFDWVYEQFVARRAGDCRLIQSPAGENVHLPKDFYDGLRDVYAERFFRQEVQGEYLDVFGGNAYYAFSEENISEVSYDRELELCWALDFNVDPMCSVIAQIAEEPRSRNWHPYSPDPRRLRVIDEIVLPDSNTEAAAAECIRRTEEFCQHRLPVRLGIYGDASGNSRSTKSSRTDYQVLAEIFRHDGRYQISMRQNRSNPGVRDRVNTMNNMLRSASGFHGIEIHPRCRELIRDLRQVKWRRDAAGNPTGELDKSDSRRTHVSDALSYLVAQE